MIDGYVYKQTAIDEINKALDRETLLNRFVRKIAVEAVKKMPSADVVKVVRCRDCKFGCYDIGDRGMYCGRKNVRLDTYEDDFCSFAERRTDESD